MKFELDVGAATFLRESVARELPCFEFRPGYPYTYVTTVYFDTDDRRFYRRARTSYDDNDKIRVKEYYYRDGESGDPGAGKEAFLVAPVCFVELKQRRGAIVTKKRLPVAKSALERYLVGSGRTSATPAAADDPDVDSDEAGRALAGYLGRYRVQPTSVICYRRQVFQVDEDQLRITFDDRIQVYPPLAGLYHSSPALTPATLGVPIRRFSRVITEIKCLTGEYPEWLQRALRDHSSKPLSKFTTSVSSVFREELVQGPQTDRPSTCRGRSSAGRASTSPAPDDTQFFSKPIES